MINVCVERELFVGNTMFRKKRINKYTWKRVEEGRITVKALMDYVLIEKRVKGRLKDVHVHRSAFAGMSDHFLVQARVEVAKEWCGRVARFKKEVVKVEELKKPEKRQAYREKVKAVYNRVKGRVAGELEEEWKLMKETLRR